MGLEGKPNNWVTTSAGKRAEDVQVHEVDQQAWRKRVDAHKASKTDKPYPFKEKQAPTPFEILIEKIRATKSELSDTVNTKPFTIELRRKATVLSDDLRRLTKQLEEYEKSQNN